MLTTDKFLINFIEKTQDWHNLEFPLSNKKVLYSLYKQLKSGHFLTEKQANLLVKLLETNTTIFDQVGIVDKSSITQPTWSQPFRVIDVVRKISFEGNKNSKILVEFTYDKLLKKKMSEFIKNCQGHPIPSNNTISILNTELNLYKLVHTFKNDNFEIDQKILNFYHEIKSILDDKEDLLNIFNERNKLVLEKVKQEIKEEENNFDLFLLDRRIRYQYSYTTKKTENSLEYKIANRKHTHIFLNKNNFNLEEILSSLDKLERFPILLIFDKRKIDDAQRYIEILEKYQKNSKKLSVGIYFRPDNNLEINKEFNKTIEKFKYNTILNSDTDCVGLSTSNLPKFMLKTSWEPKSIICFTNEFTHNKIHTFYNNVDLLISYTFTKPLHGKIDEIL